MYLLALPDLAAMLALGAALGLFGGLFGIGGGIIAIPVLVLGFGMEQPVAQGTALVMMVPNLMVGWWRYTRRYPVPVGSALGIGLVGTATTWLVAGLATRLEPELLKGLFSVFLIALAARLLVRRGRSRQEGSKPASGRFLPLVGIAGGGSMGLLGIGGGLVATPILTGWFGLRQTVAQSFSLALVAPSSVVALSAYAGAHRVDWSVGLPLAISGLFTVSAGVALAHRLPEQRLRAAFAWMILATALWLLASPLLG